MRALETLAVRIRPLAERLDQLSLRERGLVFGAGVALVYMAWQTLLMDPLAMRGRAAEQRLTDARRQLAAIDTAGAAADHDPAVAAAARNLALRQRLASIDRELTTLAQGYVAPERVTELLREMLAEQHGLRLISLVNLPAESLSAAPATSPGSTPEANDRGPFLHPVEMVVEGDYPTVVNYLRALEALPWRIQWQRLELTAGDFPTNRVRIVIGALSLSRDWISV